MCQAGGRPGPSSEPDGLGLEGEWEDEAQEALCVERPEDGWPKPEDEERPPEAEEEQPRAPGGLNT